MKKPRPKPRRRDSRNEKCGICGLPKRKHNVLGHYFVKVKAESHHWNIDG